MSIKVATQVWARYPGGGSEMLLALALADFASDDGTRIFPSVATLATKTRQGERTVQTQLKAMRGSGWLLIVANPKGGRVPTEYRINPDWLSGADLAPLEVRIQHPSAVRIQHPSAVRIQHPSAVKSRNSPHRGVPISTSRGAENDTPGVQRVAPEPSLKRQEPSVKLLSGKPDERSSLEPAQQLLAHLNERAGKSFRAVDANLRLIRGRLDSGASIEQCRRVIDAKVAEWGNDLAMRNYLRPKTLFAAANFEQYLGVLGSGKMAGISTPAYVRAGFGTAEEMARAEVAV